MTIAIDPERSYPYVLRAERGKPDATTYMLRPLCGGDARLGIKLAIGEGSRADNIYAAVQICLAGWHGLTNEDGTEILFALEEKKKLVFERPRIVATDATMGRLGAVTIAELADAAIDFSNLTGADVKN